MLKKMMLLAMALGALVAFSAPAAQAEVLLTDIEGNPVPTTEEDLAGSEITATSTNLVTTVAHPAAFPRLECAKVTIHMTVEENGPDHVVILPHRGLPPAEEALETVTTEGCALNLNGTTKLPAVITDGTVEELTINTWGEGTATATFVSDVAAAGLTNCRLEGKVNVDATHETDILHVTPSLLLQEPVSGAGCAKEGTIEGEFTLENADGPLEIDFETTE